MDFSEIIASNLLVQTVQFTTVITSDTRENGWARYFELIENIKKHEKERDYYGTRHLYIELEGVVQQNKHCDYWVWVRWRVLAEKLGEVEANKLHFKTVP